MTEHEQLIESMHQIARQRELISALETERDQARDLLERWEGHGQQFTEWPLLRETRSFLSRTPAQTAEPDPLHQTGRCACGGEGSCTWCLMIAAKERAESAEATLAAVREEAFGTHVTSVTQRLDRIRALLRAGGGQS